MPYGVIRICYNSYQTKPTDHYKVELFRALLAKGQEHTAYLMKSRCRPTDKENATRTCEEWRRAEAEEQKSSLCSKYKVKFYVKKVDEDGLPVLTEKSIKDLIDYIKTSHGEWMEYLKDEYRMYL